MDPDHIGLLQTSPHGHNIVLHNLYHHRSSHEDVVFGFRPQYGGLMKNIYHVFISHYGVG